MSFRRRMITKNLKNIFVIYDRSFFMVRPSDILTKVGYNVKVAGDGLEGINTILTFSERPSQW